MSLVEILKNASVSDKGLAADLPGAWTQGRTGYGGMTSALCLAAAQRLAEGRPLRSALIGFVGPSAGPVTVTADKLRAGRTATSVKARLGSDQGVGVEALFTFSARRPSVLDHAGPAAPAGPPGPDAKPLDFPDGAPEFTRQLEFVWAGGAAPFTGAAQPHELAWVRHRDPASRDHKLGLLCLADALPPAVSPMLEGFAPLSSMTWMIDMLSDEPRTRDGWWLLEARADHAAGGHATQDMTIWNTDGSCVAKGRQMVTVFA
ncbi:MAG: thioesterase family protein [Oceanicaulis sp.]